MTDHWMKRSAAALGAVAVLTAAPLAASLALPAGVPGSPAVAAAQGPACMRDPFSRACQLEADDERQRMNEENHERIEQQRQKHEEEHQQRMQDQQHESQCRLNSRSPGCPDAGKWSTGTKVLVGVGIGILILIIAPFVVGAIAAGGLMSEASGMRLDDDEDFGGGDDWDDDDDLGIVDYPVTAPAPAPVAAPIPAPGPAPAAGPSASPGGDPSGLWGA